MPVKARRILGDPVLHFKNGTSLRFSDVREMYLKQDAWKGIPGGKMQNRLNKMYSVFEEVKAVLDRTASGESASSVARSLGHDPQKVQHWFSGKRLPKIISPKQFRASMAKRNSFINAAAVSNPRVGYLFGIRMASQLGTYVSSRGGMSIRMGVKSGTIEREAAQAFKDVFSPHVNEKTKTRKGYGESNLSVNATEIGQFLNRATMYGQNIPTQFLKSREARRQFAMALVDASAFPFERVRKNRATVERGVFFKSSNREARDYLSRVLTEFGIENSPQLSRILSQEEKAQELRAGIARKPGQRHVLYVPPRAFKRFLEQIGFRDPKKIEQLKNFLAVTN